MEYRTIPIKDLQRSPLNVRSKEAQLVGIEELKASIHAHGLIEPLVVRMDPDAGAYVVAGGRRLLALQGLVQDEYVPDDYPVPCHVLADDADDKEISLAENVVRVAMDPADQVVAFAHLHESGQSAEEIAKRFGCSLKLVQQRLRLGGLPDPILQSYRDGEMDMKDLMAFTLTTDVDRQLRVFGELREADSLFSHHIRRHLMDKAIAGSDALARFVGREAYEAMGGTVSVDLFADEERGDGVYFDNGGLVQELAQERLEGIAAGLREEWAWCEVVEQLDWQTREKYSRIRPEPATPTQDERERLESLESKLTELRQSDEATWRDERVVGQQIDAIKAELESRAYDELDDEAKATAGCFVWIGYGGELKVERGYAEKVKGRGKGKEKDPFELSRKLVEDLRTARMDAVRHDLIQRNDLARQFMTYHMARQTFDPGGRSGYSEPMAYNPDRSAKYHGPITEFARWAREDSGLSLEWLEAEGDQGKWEAFLALGDTEQRELMGAVVGIWMHDQLASDEIFPEIEHIAATLEPDYAEHWQPTAKNFWKRITVPHCHKIAKEVLGEDWLKANRTMKKGELCKELEKAFEGKGWVPPGFVA